MALATNSTPGSIVLAGDLTGTASSPSLRVSGVIPGTYHPANIVVDAKGRIVWATTSNWVDNIQPLVPIASYTEKGICNTFQAVGECNPELTITNGVLDLAMVDANYVRYHYSYNIGTIVAGIMTLISPMCNQDCTYVDTWYTPVVGDSIIAYTYDLVDGVMTIVDSKQAHVTAVISNVEGNRVFQLDDPTLNFDTGPETNPIPCTLQRSSILVSETVSTYKGGKVTVDAVNSSLEILNDGIMKVKYATTTSKGIMQAGSGLSVTGGVLQLDPMGATGGGFGVVQIQNGGGIYVNGSGVIAYNYGNATDTNKGIASYGQYLNVTNGHVVAQVPDATGGVKGFVQVGTNIDLSAGVISLPIATTSSKGLIKAGAVGSGVSVDGNGRLTIADATTTAHGIMQAGEGIAVNAGTISLALATHSSLGIVRPAAGSFFSYGGNTLSVNTSSTSVWGVMKVGSGLDVDGSGVVSYNPADTSTSTKGIVQIGSRLVVTGGVVSVGPDVLRTNVTQSLPYIEAHSIHALSGTSVDWSGQDANIFTLSLSAPSALNNGTNLVVGSYYHFIITGAQTVTYGSQFKFKSGATSQPIGTNSVLSCYAVDANTLYCIMQPNFA